MRRMGVARVHPRGLRVTYPYALFMLHTTVPPECHKMKSCSCEELAEAKNMMPELCHTTVTTMLCDKLECNIMVHCH